MRHTIVQSLIAEVLGPRGGPNEILGGNEDPRGEYITGVLAPVKAQRIPDDIESDVDKATEEAAGADPEEDEDNESEIIAPGILTPALDPKSLPRTIGVSFCITDNRKARIEVCITWARYLVHGEGWQRQPRFFLTGSVNVNDEQTWNPESGLTLVMRSRNVGQNARRISLFLVNNTEPKDPTKPTTDEYIFQPQIRVYCLSNTKLLPVRSDNCSTGGQQGSLAFEDEALSMLYRNKAALARGHLCGAMWKDIDPERLHPTIQSNAAPFAWTDGFLLPETERRKFSPADVRTELTPCYPIAAPEMGWQDKYGKSPVLDPNILAETWQPREIKEALEPLVEGYSAWLSLQQREVDSWPASERSMANLQIQECRQVADRMREGITTLAKDENARLAFCFANKAIATQSRWSKGQVISWRPFQLGFILLNIPALANPAHIDRLVCDLLWFPTGGGKTEAYLGLTAFVLALRRRRRCVGNTSNNGVGVLSRYTLRLLTIQQFRRALGVITACEFLRVQGLNTSTGYVGWRPSGYTRRETFIWGGARFSIGLWVGGSVTPNNLLSIGPILSDGRMIFFAGALDILQGVDRNYHGPNTRLQRAIQASPRIEANGEPAQVTHCPVCKSLLTVPDEGLKTGKHTVHFVFECKGSPSSSSGQINTMALPLIVDTTKITHHRTANFHTLSLTFTVRDNQAIQMNDLDEWWYREIAPSLGSNVTLAAARPSRPGYFILTFDNTLSNSRQCDFDIYCPNPECELNSGAWAEQVPLARSEVSNWVGSPPTTGQGATATTAELPMSSGLQWQNVPEVFREGVSSRIADRVPIPALTVDDQIYHRCPSLVVATVDKFARLAFEPRAGSIFGNVTHYHARWGYYREGAPPSWDRLSPIFREHPPGLNARSPLHTTVSRFQPPDLIIQDELHLIEGPLGSMVGLYETAIDLLNTEIVGEVTIKPKYIASTATVRQAETQVKALFDRRVVQFPPSCLSADDRFFAKQQLIHPLDAQQAGRLYVAVCAPGKGAQTPIIRIWARLLQSVFAEWQSNQTMELDRFWTLVGYFNAVRELAGALSLFRQDIPERIEFIGRPGPRPLDRWLELSGRKTTSLDLPSILERLAIPLPTAEDAIFATSMFGTGVDVDRLGLMVVHGQPKTTASYIQATGRVGRRTGGLVITFLRASRPRDLDHYEFFTGYHQSLHKYVEPVTVAPFSPRARERALGPLCVALLRQAHHLGQNRVDLAWLIQQRLIGSYYSQASRMRNHRHDAEANILSSLLEERANRQPLGRRPRNGIVASEAASELDRWSTIAALHPSTDEFVYSEPALLNPPQRHVVLGDAQHRAAGLSEAYENAPQSLRDVEDTTSFRT